MAAASTPRKRTGQGTLVREVELEKAMASEKKRRRAPSEDKSLESKDIDNLQLQQAAMMEAADTHPALQRAIEVFFRSVIVGIGGGVADKAKLRVANKDLDDALKDLLAIAGGIGWPYLYALGETQSMKRWPAFERRWVHELDLVRHRMDPGFKIPSRRWQADCARAEKAKCILCKESLNTSCIKAMRGV